MVWYKKVINDNKKEMVRSAIISLVITFALSLWYFVTGKGFERVNIEPISTPTLSIRLLSALAFVSIGRILYKLKVYYVLYMVLVVALRNKSFYNNFKKVIWYSIMFIIGFYIAPWIIGVLNIVVSFLYNMSMLILYLVPVMGIFLIAFLSTYAVIVLIKGGSGKKQSLANDQSAKKTEGKEKILVLAREKGDVKNDDVEKLLGISNATAERYLNELESEGKLTQHGKIGQGVFYTLKQ